MNNKQIKDFYDERNLVPKPKNQVDTTDSETPVAPNGNFNDTLLLAIKKLLNSN